ncbi:hypothetical protein [Halotalea alkalilenta]|uniref:hypothetical protein n=1 Tax=Halotalea alkalilenta TaxID=376489 RepID=UPI000694B2EA|nr:hypothetical protein [Halotalea alkalilenta]
MDLKIRASLSALILATALLATGAQAADSATAPASESFQPMRSFIMVSVRDDSDLPAAYRWLYKYHVPDSISQFAPYVTKYATYRALPLPKDAEDFGTYNWIMTEHYWLLNPFHTSATAAPNGLAFKEYSTDDYMRITRQPTGGDLRPSQWVGTREGYHPTVFAFAPVFWEDDFKGSDRTIEDGPNYRWLTLFKYPEGVTQEEGDKWFREQLAPQIAGLPEVTRFLSSRVLAEPKTGPFQRVAEIWFSDSKQWEQAMAELGGRVAKPAWAKWDKFPYMEPYKDFVGEFLLDRPESDHLQQYKGYVSTR